jgi:hypothetical protein
MMVAMIAEAGPAPPPPTITLSPVFCMISKAGDVDSPVIPSRGPSALAMATSLTTRSTSLTCSPLCPLYPSSLSLSLSLCVCRPVHSVISPLPPVFQCRSPVQAQPIPQPTPNLIRTCRSSQVWSHMYVGRTFSAGLVTAPVIKTKMTLSNSGLYK